MRVLELWVRSWTDPARLYLIEVTDQGVRCGCRGFAYARHCKHADLVDAFARMARLVLPGEVEAYDPPRALPSLRPADGQHS